MPPKKRSAPKDAANEPPKKSQRSSNAKGKENQIPIVGPGEHDHGHGIEHENEHEHEHEDEDDDDPEPEHYHEHDRGNTPEGHDHNMAIPPHQYICIDRPMFDKQNDPKADATNKDNMWKKPASEHPDWPWELQENLIVDFNKEFSKKEPNLNQMWGTMAGLVLWMLNDEQNFIHHDDGERMDATVGLIGTAFLALLNEVDLAGQLKPDWEIRDLALVMAMYLQWAYDKPDYGLEDVKWMKDVVAYAKKGGIDLKAAPLCTVGDRLKKFSKTVALKGEAKADRWKFSKKFKDYERRYSDRKMPGIVDGGIGGTSYDITKMSREQRAKHAFDNADPLADIPEKELKEVNIMIA